MEKHLSALTEKQRTAFLLREQGYTYRQIAEEMGISQSAARQNVQGAVRRLHEYELYKKELEMKKQPAAFPLTRGELEIIVLALLQLEKDILKQAGGNNIKNNWENRLPYQAGTVSALFKRAQKECYGKELYKDMLE